MNRTIGLKTPFSIVLILLITNLPVMYAMNADDNTDTTWEIYSRGLELIIDGNTAEAVEIFNRLISDYPLSDAAAKAQTIIERLNNKVDHSGIIPFYLGNMLTSTLVFSSIPVLFDTDNTMILGTSGIAGVGTGLYSAWLMSSDTDISLGQSIWIEFIEAASMVNFQLAYSTFSEWITDEEIKSKINIGGMAATALGSRTVSYITGKRLEPSRGRSFTVANSYLWSQYYLWIVLNQIVMSENEDLNRSLAIIIPDTVAAGTYFLWDSLNWSLRRTGLISVSGAGGSLFGIFTAMILDGIAGTSLSSQLRASIILGSALAGKYLGIRFTGNMKPETSSRSPNPADLFVMPAVSDKGETGFTVTIRM